MKVISTFAGFGGSSTGYEMADCEVVASVEWDHHAVQCYRLNHPNTKIFQGDIAKIKGEDLLNATGLDVGELDILDGSPPCQGFSTVGARILDDPRNSLFQEHIRLVRELKPKNVLIENVSGMLKGAMRNVAREIILSLQAEGYTVAAGLLSAQYFGVPQLRPRVFFIGSRIGTPFLPKPISRPLPCGPAIAHLDLSKEEFLPLGEKLQRILAFVKPGENLSQALLRGGGKETLFSSFVLDPRKPSYTITKSSPRSIIHWEKRCLTNLEALVLTGFPETYRMMGSFAQKRARIGNSVAPPMSREIARQVFWKMGR